MIHTLIKPSSFMTFYFADIPGSDTKSIVEITKLGSDPNTELYYKEGYKTPYDKNILSYLQPLNKNRQFTILNETDRNIRIKSTYDNNEYDINLKTHPELFKTLKNLKK